MQNPAVLVRRGKVIGVLLAGFALACGTDENPFDVEEPARGPSQLLPSGSEQVTDGNFAGGNDTIPELPPPADGAAWAPQMPITCDQTCRDTCDSFGLENPVNQGLCPDLWGPGGVGAPVIEEEACRRLWIDTVGRLPSYNELHKNCLGKPWGEVVKARIDDSEFVRLNRRHWADRLRYDTESVSVERIFDMDEIVKATYQGRISYDQFASLLSAHPVLTRRNATAGDRAEALFWLLLGRPPFGKERSDVGRLFALWDNNYYDHPQMGMRLPDAFVRYRCINSDGEIDRANSGECTSDTFGFEQLILKPDARARRDERGGLIMWSGLLAADEWEKLQAPGRLMTEQRPFWENAANVVLDQYLGYKLATMVPRVGEQLVQYVLANNGDIRSLHYAVLTSYPYRQSAFGAQDAPLRYTYGPLKQIDAEGWVDSMDVMTGRKLERCDLRINRPRDFLESDSAIAHALVDASEWKLNDEGEVESDYRDLVRNLGGCPDNSQGGRFKIVSVLTTANQLNYATRLCDPTGDGEARIRTNIERLLPGGVSPNEAMSAELAGNIFNHQTHIFYGRGPTAEELQSAQTHGESCAAAGCTAEQFARPACFALLSSSEMLFY